MTGRTGPCARSHAPAAGSGLREPADALARSRSAALQGPQEGCEAFGGEHRVLQADVPSFVMRAEGSPGVL